MKMEINDFEKTRCSLLYSGKSIFLYIMQATNNNPCTIGCAWYADGKCPDYKEILSKRVPQLKNTPSTVETNAQMAERLGITKRQASKLRRK